MGLKNVRVYTIEGRDEKGLSLREQPDLSPLILKDIEVILMTPSVANRVEFEDIIDVLDEHPEEGWIKEIKPWVFADVRYQRVREELKLCLTFYGYTDF